MCMTLFGFHGQSGFGFWETVHAWILVEISGDKREYSEGMVSCVRIGL